MKTFFYIPCFLIQLSIVLTYLQHITMYLVLLLWEQKFISFLVSVYWPVEKIIVWRFRNEFFWRVWRSSCDRKYKRFEWLLWLSCKKSNMHYRKATKFNSHDNCFVGFFVIDLKWDFCEKIWCLRLALFSADTNIVISF